MENRPPTLAEMKKILDADSSEGLGHSAIDKLVEGNHLKHFGIKGMKWGIRRSDREIARIKNSDGEDVGGIKASSRADANKLRKMKAGEVVVLDTADSGPKVLVKQSDNTFKEAKLSADAQSVLRTVGKEQSEMSTREMKEATARAQAIEQYNKVFNPVPDPNAELKAKVEAMELQTKMSVAYARANPSRVQRVAGFIDTVKPAFSAFATADKALNGALSANLKSTIEDLTKASKATSAATNTAKAATNTAKAAPSKAKMRPNPGFKKKGNVPSTNDVWDISTMERVLGR